jgi:hypothetical protein
VLRHSDEGTSVKWGATKTFSAEDIRGAVQELIGTCTAGIWLRILPLDEDNESLYFHTGQEWADVQPCLQECGLVTTPRRFGGKLSAPIREWTQFAAASAGLFEVGTARPRKGTTSQRTNSIFIMRKPILQEEPKYASPIKQLKADRFEVPRLTLSPSEVQLQQYFRHGRIHLLSKLMDNAINQKSASELVASVARIHNYAAPIDVDAAPIDADAAPINNDNVAINDDADAAPIDNDADTGDTGPINDNDAALIGTCVAPLTTDVAPIGAPVTVTPSEKRRLGDEVQLDNLEFLWEAAIEKALALDLTIQPRLSRDGTGQIVKLHDRALAETNHRLIALHVAKAWGWNDHRFDYITRQRIAEAACRQVSYDFGYKKSFSYSRLPDWDKGVDKYSQTGDTTQACGKSRTGRKSYVDQIEAAHNGYLL